MIFFGSDWHFGHTNIIKYEKRPFANIDDMNHKMIENWNNKITSSDSVYILGDFILSKQEIAVEILRQLKGQKFLIKGNHDSIVKKPEVKKYFAWIKDYYSFNMDGNILIMCHYPFLTWDRSHYGSVNLYGHIHSNKCKNIKFNDNQYNVGVDINNFEPCTLDEVIQNNKTWMRKGENNANL